jgi:hypothetical protein
VSSPARPGVGLGLVGCGRFGAAILEAARELPGLAPVAVADRDPDRAAALAAAHRLDAVDPRRLLDDDRVEVVAVATPPAGHARVALDALAAGRHVFCEKPLATRLEDATAVLRATARPGAPRLTVDYVLRRNPLYALLGTLQRELLGPPRRFAFENLASDEHLGPDHWFWDREVSGGILVEHGVHFFDACAWLLGSQPELVQAVEAARPGGPVDTVVATARHPGGATASFAHAFARPARNGRPSTGGPPAPRWPAGSRSSCSLRPGPGGRRWACCNGWRPTPARPWPSPATGRAAPSGSRSSWSSSPGSREATTTCGCERPSAARRPGPASTARASAPAWPTCWRRSPTAASRWSPPPTAGAAWPSPWPPRGRPPPAPAPARNLSRPTWRPKRRSAGRDREAWPIVSGSA